MVKKITKTLHVLTWSPYRLLPLSLSLSFFFLSLSLSLSLTYLAAYIPCYIWMKNETLLAPGEKSRFFLTCIFYALQGITLISSLFGAVIIRYHEKDPEQSYFYNLSVLFDHGDVFNRESKWSPLIGFWFAGTQQGKKYFDTQQSWSHYHNSNLNVAHPSVVPFRSALETAVMFLVFLPIFFVPSIKASVKTLKTQ